LVAGCSKEEPSIGEQAIENVVLVVIDTLRADHLGCYGYPRETSPVIDELAERGVRFANAFAPWPETSQSVASLLTGLYPQRTGVVRATPNRLPQRLTTLPERLRAAGYQTVAAVENPVLSEELHFDQGYEVYLGSWEESSWKPADRLAVSWLRTQRDPERPFYLYLHLIDPHAPYEPKGTYDEMFVGDEHYDPAVKVEVRGRDRLWDAVGGFPGFSRLEGHDELAFYVAQYDAEIRSVDARLGSFLNELGESVAGTLVILAADHGEGLGEHDYYWHGLLPYDETSHVPLVFSHPGLKPAVVDDLATLVDITPTILGLLKISTDEELDGVDLSPLFSSQRAQLERRWVYTESGDAEQYQRSIRDESHKLIFVPDSGEQQLLRGAQLELYHVTEDPGETVNLADSRPEIRDELFHQLRAWMRELPAEESPSEPLSPEAAERIRSLGYVQ
jgi:arylsulfatase A-like enzyme